MTEMVDSGLIELWRNKYSVKPKFCQITQASQTVIADTKSLSYIDIGGAFILFGFGTILAFSMMLIEILRFKKYQNL